MRAAPKKTEDRKILQELVPLNALSEERFQELASKIIIEEVKAGRYLFRQGDRDNQSIYLLDGKVNLIDGFRKVVGEVEAGTDISRYPIAGQQPRPFSARVVKKAVIARIDSGLLDVFLTWDQSSTAEVMEIGVDENNDWMTRLLQSEAFCQLPPAKLQGLLMKMRPVSVSCGEVVIEEGSEGDYFYTIHEGRCVVTRTDKSTGMVQTLAELSDGDSFGEEALVSSGTRNATITMLTDGQLMQLAKRDFEELLHKELVKHVSLEQSELLVQEGAVWVDVRTPDEYQQGSFEDSVNIPLSSLRGELPELVFNAKYIICCDTGRRSESAGFLLSHKGFDVYVLEGGISGKQSDADESMDDGVFAADLRDPVVTLASDTAELFPDTPWGVAGAVASAEATVDAGTDPAADASEQLLRLQSEYDALHGQYEALLVVQQQQDVAKESLENQLEQLRGELGESAEKLTEIFTRSSGLDEERQLLREQYAALQEEHADMLSTLQADLDKERHHAQHLQRELETITGERAMLGEQVESGRLDLQTTLDTVKSELDESRRKIAMFESRLDEVSSEREQLQQENRELNSELAGLQAMNDSAGGELEKRDEVLDQLRAGNAALEQQLESVRADLAERQLQLDSVTAESTDRLEALQHQYDEQLVQLKQMQDLLAGESKDNAQASAAITSLQEENNHLRSSMRELNSRIAQQFEQIENLGADRRAIDDLNSKQQLEWEKERDALQVQLAELNALSARLQDERLREQEELQQTRESFEKQHLEQVDRYNAALEKHEQQFAEMRSSLSVKNEELDLARQEQQHLQKQLVESVAENSNIEEKVTALQAEITRLAEGSDQQITELQGQIQAGEQNVLQLQNEVANKDEQLTALRLEINQHELASTVHVQELDLLRAQLQEMQGAHELHGEQVRNLEQSIQEAARKAHEDLKRKNDNEKELQGQVERLRKKLEQVTGDYQKSRKDAQDNVDQLREELHAERQARDDERAQMAARQRELKEQLTAVASEHEVNFSNQSGVIEEAIDAARKDERARLQGVMDTHAATESLLEQVQQELRQARTELAEYRRLEKDRRQGDVELIEEQNQQAEAAISQLHTQLKQLTEERDDALEQQITLRERMDALRGEVEVARGLMNASAQGCLEDPVKLRKQLDETRKNVEIAVRLRAEAEAARDRLQDECDRLLVQVGGGQGQGAFSNTSAPVIQPESMAKAVYEPAAATRKEKPAAGKSRPQSPATDQKRTWSRWLFPAISMAILVVSGVLVWSLLGEYPSLQDETSMDEASSADVVLPVQSVPNPQQSSVLPDTARTEQSSRPGVSPAPLVVEPAHEPDAVVPDPASAQAEKAPVVAVAPAPVVRTFSDSLKSGGNGPRMVQLAPATFQMGSVGNSINSEEVPRHDVTLGAYSISSHEVTFADYDRYARATGQRLPYDESWGRGKQPVINVSWKDAQGYVKWLSVQTGNTYRLPTEAEWEYAARAGNVASYWWTEVYETIPANCFNCGSKWDGARTAPVGQFAANSLGLYDMAGNVQEWTADCYHQNYVGAPADGSAWEGVDCSQRVVRGGAYSSPLNTLRSANRAQLAEDTRLDNLGFRVVRAE